MFKFYCVSILFMSASYICRQQNTYFIYYIQIGSKSKLTGGKAFTLGIFDIWALINVTLMPFIFLADTSCVWKWDIRGKWILILLPLFLPSLPKLTATASTTVEKTIETFENVLLFTPFSLFFHEMEQYIFSKNFGNSSSCFFGFG